MHRKEEEFRKADNERMRRFFNARFDDIPGALAGEVINAKRAFRDNTEAFSPPSRKQDNETSPTKNYASMN